LYLNEVWNAQIPTGWDGVHAAVTLPHPPGLVRLDMIYDPVRGNADISVDGKTLKPYVDLHPTRSVRRASGLVQTRKSPNLRT